MSKLGTRHLALALSIAAVAAAGCGSSSKSKTTAAPASTPATPSTASTSTTAKVTASTPLTDPAVHGALVAAARATVPAHITNAQLDQLVSCVVKKLEAQGVKTAGQLNQHTSAAGSNDVKNASSQCGKQLGLKK